MSFFSNFYERISQRQVGKKDRKVEEELNSAKQSM